MSIRKIAFAVGALVAGSAAMGATLPGNGNSNLFLIVYNANASSTGETYVQALSNTVTTLPTSTTTFTGIDTSLSQLETDLGTTSVSDLNYAVVAANLNGTSSELGFTSATTPTITTGTQVSNGAGLLNAWLGNIGIGTAQNSAAVSAGVLTFTGTNGAGADLGIGGTSQNTVGVATGSPMEFYSAVEKASGKTFAASVTDLLGTFSFSFANDSLTYTTGSTSPVPLPAAAWLLMSGLAGVGSLSRRSARASGAAAA